MGSKPTIVKIDYHKAIEQYDLAFLPDYCAEIYQGEWLIFEENASFEMLDLDKLSENNKYAILFLQDLHVLGAIVQEETDYGPLVVVKGKTLAQNIYAGGGDLFFCDDIFVQQTIIGVYNHGTVHFKGTIEAELIISDDHAFNIYKPCSDRSICLGFDEHFLLKDYLKPRFYNSYDEIIEDKAVLKAIKEGLSLKKEGEILTPIEKRISKFEKSKKSLLDLSAMDLKEIPQAIFDLDTILELDLSANYISQLPSELLNLKRLKKIRLYNCDFTEFPTLLLEIPTLEEIDLGMNSIQSLPSDLDRLSQLKKLLLYNCSFNKFPQSVYSLSRLEELDIAYQENQPALTIDRAFPKLKVLNVHANFNTKITVVQPALQTLNMRNCGLSEFPLLLTNCAKLKSVDLTLNDIKIFPKEVSQLKNLTHFSFSLKNLDSNSIELLQNLPKLQRLTVEFRNDKEPQQIVDLLALEYWDSLCVEGYLEDQFIIRNILKRRNLKKLSYIDSSGDETKVDIKEGRAMLGIKM